MNSLKMLIGIKFIQKHKNTSTALAWKTVSLITFILMKIINFMYPFGEKKLRIPIKNKTW